MLGEMAQMAAQFGVAGLMGVLWVWERRMSRLREQQLSETHEQLMRQREPLRLLVKLVRRNTQAIERFDQTQQQLSRLLERVNDEMQRRAA